MEAQWQADRAMLRTLLHSQPDWSQRDLAQAVGRSLGWVKQWVKRLRAVPLDDQTVLRRQSRARKHPPPRLSQGVIERRLAIRAQPPAPLHRIPGPRTIRDYLEQDAELQAQALRLPRSTRTIWRILQQYGRIAQRTRSDHVPVERPTPLTSWQLDFKDVATVPAAPEGKPQPAVEVLNPLDPGTAILLNAQVREDFTAETALHAVADTLRLWGLPEGVTCDRDPRLVGSRKQRDCPSPLVRFWICLGVAVTICPPQRPDKHAFIERYHRTYAYACLRIYRPADVTTVKTVTESCGQFYNEQRPHQGLSWGNPPPRCAFPTLPARPPLPPLVDPDRWLETYDGRRCVRKVQRDCRVMVDDIAYDVPRALVGKYITLRRDAAAREVVVEAEAHEVKRLAIKGLGTGPLPLEAYLLHMCQEARTERVDRRAFGDQLSLPF
jgi:hypothetical protein